MEQADQTQVAEVVREFGNRVLANEWDEVALTLRISGGMPSQRRREEFELQGTGSVLGRYSDAISARVMREESRTFDAAETHQLFRQAAAAVAKLVERPLVRFSPDSLVGSITVKVRSRQATLYFTPEDERSEEATQLPLELRDSLGRLRIAFQRLRRGDDRR